MKIITSAFLLLCFLIAPMLCSAQSDEKTIRSLLDEFFVTIGTKDSVAYKKLFLKDGYKYIVAQRGDSIRSKGYSVFSENSFKTKAKFKEVIREKGLKIEVHKYIAMAWVPYDFWVDDKFSHCGVDVFTYMKTNNGWKIAVIAYSVERDGCKDW